MSIFAEYAEYYDLIYADKDYVAEADFVLNKLSAPNKGNQTILELGCGTGRHALEFLERGFSVSGVDMSTDMISLARSRVSSVLSNAAVESFMVGDIRNVRLERKFDYVVSLFHVFSYQSTDLDLSLSFDTASLHLADNGRLLFDFWYGPAVIADPPLVRKRNFRGSDFSVTRTATPKIFPPEHLVDVHYDLVFSPDHGDAVTFHESHRMRYFFLPEIREYLEKAGLQLLSSGAWMSDKELSDSTWYGWVMAGRS